VPALAAPRSDARRAAEPRPALSLKAKGGSPPPEAPALPPGYKLGPYLIVRRLSVGGMADVYLAEPARGGPRVVLKRLQPHLATQREYVQMFLEEAKLVSRLRHPELVESWGLCRHRGHWLLVMEHLDGLDLRAVASSLRRRCERMDLALAIEAARAVCRALHHAHELRDRRGELLGIVHRDVSPHNVMVTRAGRVKLLDFGLAKAAHRETTRSGVLKGKLSYMSPEQCRGLPLDRRSDLFSLGVVLHELTLGRRLYRCDDDFEVLKRIVEGEVDPPRRIDPDYPEPLERVVMRALAKDREDRFRSAREMEAALAQAADETGLYAPPGGLAQLVAELTPIHSEPTGEISLATEPTRPFLPAGRRRLPLTSAPALIAGVLALLAVLTVCGWRVVVARPIPRAAASWLWLDGPALAAEAPAPEPTAQPGPRQRRMLPRVVPAPRNFSATDRRLAGGESVSRQAGW
jgi:serine/threonine-protein kinase